MPYQIKPLTEVSCDAWDRFVEASPAATFFHRLGWRSVIENSFGHKPHYCYVEEGGRICGVLPLFHVASRLFGNRLSSIPFCVAGAPISDSIEAECLLDRESIRLMDELGVEYVEYRDDTRHRPGWTADQGLYASFLAAMEAEEEKQLARIPRKQRAVLRKALATRDLTWTIDEDPRDLFQLFCP